MLSNQGLYGAMLGLVTLPALDTITIKLFKEPITPGADVVAADFTEADYSGYADVEAPKVGSPYRDNVGNVCMSFESAHFQPTSFDVENTIYGWFAVGGSGTMNGSVIGWQVFSSPVVLATPAQALDVIATFKLGQPRE